MAAPHLKSQVITILHAAAMGLAKQRRTCHHSAPDHKSRCDYPPKYKINFLLRSNGEGWAVATAPQPDRYKPIDVINKRRVLLRATVGTVIPPKQTVRPPPSSAGFGWGFSHCVIKGEPAGIVHVQSSLHAMRGDHPWHTLYWYMTKCADERRTLALVYLPLVGRKPSSEKI